MIRPAVFLAVQSLAIALLPAGSAPAAAAATPAAIPTRVDLGVELITIVFRLAGAEEYNRAPDCAYVRDVDEHFRPFAGHPVVAAARRLRRERGIGHDAVVQLPLYLEEPPALAERVPLEPRPASLDPRWTIPEARAFLVQLRDFARVSDFAGFADRHRADYEAAVGRLAALVAAQDYRAWFDHFFGPRPEASFLAIVSLLDGPGSYGPRIALPDGREQIAFIMGVSRLDEQGLPVFTPDQGLVCLHEWCHSYVNPVVDAHVAELMPSGLLIFPHVAAIMTEQAYAAWPTVVVESCVRACTARFLLWCGGQEAPSSVEGLLRSDRGRGFVWIDQLAALLGEYEADRDRYPTFDAFFGRVVAFFDSYAQRDLETELALPQPSINRVLERGVLAGEGVVVQPGAGQGAATDALRAYVAAVAGKVFAPRGVPLVDVDEVSQEQREGPSLVLYGSPATNPLVAGALAAAGITVGEGGIELPGRSVEGDGLVLIAALPNPDRDDGDLLAYTAARDDLLAGINRLFHGPTGWVIGRHGADGALETVARGDFVRRGASGAMKVVE